MKLESLAQLELKRSELSEWLLVGAACEPRVPLLQGFEVALQVMVQPLWVFGLVSSRWVGLPPARSSSLLAELGRS